VQAAEKSSPSERMVVVNETAEDVRDSSASFLVVLLYPS
jgi:hypothetical protein